MIDGPLLLGEALAAGVTVEDVFAEPEAPERALEELADRVGTIHRVPTGTLARVTGTVTPQHVAAIGVSPLRSTAEAVARAATGPLALVLAGVADPGNAGTLLRAAEASGAAAVLFCGGSVDPTNPKCVRASAGALFHVTVAIGGGVEAVLGELRAAGLRTVATAARAGLDCTEADLSKRVALVLGNEAHGIEPGTEAPIDEWVTIPMVGRSESLNVAMAGSILCYEALRQRRSAEAVG